MDLVENAVNGTYKLISKIHNCKKNLFDESYPIFLQINSFKMPKKIGAIKKIFRVPMKHSIHPTGIDVCLIVSEVPGIGNKDHEEHVEHYQELLNSKGVSGIKKIMTFHEFRTEYDTFELKNRLVNLYDVFLVDGKISGKVVHKCGKVFYTKRKLPIAVRLTAPKLKVHFDNALKKSFINLTFKSDSHTVQVGNNQMKVEHVVENIYSAADWVNVKFPGNFENIRSLYVFSDKTTWIPIYVSIKNPNDVKVPIVKNPRPKLYETFTDELSTQLNADVVVKPSGKVIVKRKKPTKELLEFLHSPVEGVPKLKKRKITHKKSQKKQ